MIVRLSTLTTAELEGLHDQMANCATWLKTLGHYAGSCSCRAVAQEAAQHLLRRQADQRQYVARQLSLVPPSTYEEPL